MIGTQEGTAGTPAWRRTGRVFGHCLPGLWLLALVSWQFTHGGDVYLAPLLAATPVISAVATGRRPCVVASGVWSMVVLAFLAGAGMESPGHALAVCGSILVVAVAGCLVVGRRTRLAHELRLTREAAMAVQEALLRPLPERVGGLEIAAGHLAATRGAALGGDLYEAAATPYGVRVLIGDVRGHGLEAVSTVAAVLGTFREAAHDEPELPGVLRRLERGLMRHLAARGAVAEDPADAAEAFVTVLLLEVGARGSVAALNCGHPWPYLLEAPQLPEAPPGSPVRAGAPAVPVAAPTAVPVTEDEPMPPLGLFPLPCPLPAPHSLVVPSSMLLCLFTDGLQDARGTDGALFPLPEALAGAVPGAAGRPAALVRTVREELLGHTGGRLCDDAAVLVLRATRASEPQPPGTERPGPHPPAAPLTEPPPRPAAVPGCGPCR